MKKILSFFSNNFWGRNALLMTILAILEQLIRQESGWLNKTIAFGISALLYCWFVFHNRILFEKLLLRRYYLFYFVLLAAGCVLYSLIMYSNTPGGITTAAISRGAGIGLFNTIFGTLIFLAFRYFKEQQEFMQNKLYLFEMEQTYLKNQLSSHFLFNTLNNIYSYSLTESKKTPELILQLSEMMRYLVQFNKKKEITLLEETRFIENYIVFEKERLEDRCKITFIYDPIPDEITIEPLLFFPLIENAFKHGTNTIHDCFVTIEIRLNKNRLNVLIENTILAQVKPSTNSGIENVRKRLQLFYPNRHNLMLEKKEDRFSVELQLELHS